MNKKKSGSSDDFFVEVEEDLGNLEQTSSAKKTATLEKELEILKLYIEIMKARFQDKLKVRMEIGEQTQQALVPGFILQPLVENSIKHSMESLQTTEITIISRKETNQLQLIVKDNGPGITGEPDQALENGVGLSNTLERLEKLSNSSSIGSGSVSDTIREILRPTAPALSSDMPSGDNFTNTLSVSP